MTGQEVYQLVSLRQEGDCEAKGIGSWLGWAPQHVLPRHVPMIVRAGRFNAHWKKFWRNFIGVHCYFFNKEPINFLDPDVGNIKWGLLYSSNSWEKVSFEIGRNIKNVSRLFFQHILFKESFVEIVSLVLGEGLQAVSRKLLIRLASALASIIVSVVTGLLLNGDIFRSMVVYSTSGSHTRRSRKQGKGWWFSWVCYIVSPKPDTNLVLGKLIRLKSPSLQSCSDFSCVHLPYDGPHHQSVLVMRFIEEKLCSLVTLRSFLTN